MAVSPTPRFAYVTLLTQRSYLAGVLVLWLSLRKSGAKYPLVVMVTSSLCRESRSVLSVMGIAMREVEHLRPPFDHTLARSDSRFADTWTKLRGFGLLEHERIVLLDSDMVVRRNMDDLFSLRLPRDHIAAVHVCACNPFRLAHYPMDWLAHPFSFFIAVIVIARTPKNCAHTAMVHPLSPPPKVLDALPRPYHLMNSGTLVLNPSRELSETVLRVLETDESVRHFQFPDQDLMALVFKGKWTPLPWYYNALRTMQTVHPAMWDEKEARVVHYILSDKPWMSRRSKHPPFQTMQDWWWDVFDEAQKMVKRENSDAAEWVASLVHTA